jgi:hypothetical protein
MRRVAVVVVMLAGSLAYANLPANPKALAHYQAGLDHFPKTEYAEAIDELKMSYALEPATDTLYALAQAERLNHNCPAAIKLYTKYMGQSISPVEQQAASSGLAKCAHESNQDDDDTSVTPTTPKVEPKKPPEDKKIVETPPPPPPHGSPWYTDVLGDVLVGAGIVGLAIGGIEFAASSSAADAAGAATTYGDYQSNIEDAQSKRTIAIIGLSAGSALVIGGIIRYATRSSGPKESSTNVGAWLGGGGGVVVFGRF